MSSLDLSYHVEEIDPRTGDSIETLASCSNAVVGRGAFQAAVEMRPKASLVFRHRARVINTHN